MPCLFEGVGGLADGRELSRPGAAELLGESWKPERKATAPAAAISRRRELEGKQDIFLVR
jgi:hypothetical protein